MKNINRSGLIIFLVIAFLFSSFLIPANTQARVKFKREVSFGEPGDLPVISPVSNTINSSETTATASSTGNNPTETECVSALFLYSRILFDQFISFIF